MQGSGVFSLRFLVVQFKSWWLLWDRWITRKLLKSFRKHYPPHKAHLTRRRRQEKLFRCHHHLPLQRERQVKLTAKHKELYLKHSFSIPTHPSPWLLIALFLTHNAWAAYLFQKYSTGAGLSHHRHLLGLEERGGKWTIRMGSPALQ